MPESSLQDLRDDWSVGDRVLVEYHFNGSTTTALKAGRIIHKDAAFATVFLDNNGTKQSVAYKRLRRPARKPVQQELRAVPPAFARIPELVEAPRKIVPLRQTEPPAPPEPPPAPVMTSTVVVAPLPEPEKPRVLVVDVNTWMRMGRSVLDRMEQQRRVIKDKHDKLMNEADKLAAEMAGIQAEIDQFQKLRDYVTRERPKIQLSPIGFG